MSPPYDYRGMNGDGGFARGVTATTTTAATARYALDQCFYYCPRVVATYAALHLDSIPKILNHLLLITAILDLLLFVSSWSVSALPNNVGINTVLLSILLLMQCMCVYLIVNNHRLSTFAFLAPTDFMLGVAFGITVGGTIIAFVLSSMYRHGSPPRRYCAAYYQAEQTQHDAMYEYICGRQTGGGIIWFWSSLAFWFNFCSCLLLGLGRHELAQTTLYEQIGAGMTLDDVEGHFHEHAAAAAAAATATAVQHRHHQPQHHHHQQQQPNGDGDPIMAQQQPNPNPGYDIHQTSTGTVFSGITVWRSPSFVGDYSTIPEVRPGELDGSYSSSSSTGRSGSGIMDSGSGRSYNHRSSRRATTSSHSSLSQPLPPVPPLPPLPPTSDRDARTVQPGGHHHHHREEQQQPPSSPQRQSVPTAAVARETQQLIDTHRHNHLDYVDDDEEEKDDNGSANTTEAKILSV